MESFNGMCSYVERSRLAARTVIDETSCELASSLLALELSRVGQPAEFVRGHYLQPGETETARNGHAWVEVGEVRLDPTRDQFHEDPRSKTHRGRYVSTERRAASEDLVYAHLALQWRVRLPAVQDRICAVCEQYGLDADQLEDRAAKIFLTAPVGRNETPQDG